MGPKWFLLIFGQILASVIDLIISSKNSCVKFTQMGDNISPLFVPFQSHTKVKVNINYLACSPPPCSIIANTFIKNVELTMLFMSLGNGLRALKLEQQWLM